MANDEMAPFLGVFLDEANEQIELLEQDILKLESESAPALLQKIIVQRGATISLIRLHSVFYGAWDEETPQGLEARFPQVCGTGGAGLEPSTAMLCVVVVGAAERQIGLVVDGLLGEQEIVIKSLGRFIGDIRGVSGAAILGDGRIALIVDVTGLLAIAMKEKVHAHAA